MRQFQAVLCEVTRIIVSRHMSEAVMVCERQTDAIIIVNLK